MTGTKTSGFLMTFCIFIAILTLTSGIETAICEDDIASDRTYPFVTEALQLRGASGWNRGGRAGPFVSNASDKWVTDWQYNYASEEADVTVFAQYMAEGKGLYFVSTETTKSSQVLPLCLQPTANTLDRAKDFLKRYQNWTQDANLTEIIGTLDLVGAGGNCSVVIGTLNLTVAANRYATDFYWGYTSNGTYSRGLGITFVSNRVFFRDDRNLLLPPCEPPSNIFTSRSPYMSKAEEPNPPAARPVNESFEFMTPRPAPIMELYLDPEAEIAPVVKEQQFYSGHFTFHLEQPLLPNTLYTATLVCGQDAPADFDEAPVILLSWWFMTENGTQTSETQSPTQTPIASAESIPSMPQSSLSASSAEAYHDGNPTFEWAFTVAIVFAGIAVLVASVLVVRARAKRSK